MYSMASDVKKDQPSLLEQIIEVLKSSPQKTPESIPNPTSSNIIEMSNQIVKKYNSLKNETTINIGNYSEVILDIDSFFITVKVFFKNDFNSLLPCLLTSRELLLNAESKKGYQFASINYTKYGLTEVEKKLKDFSSVVPELNSIRDHEIKVLKSLIKVLNTQLELNTLLAPPTKTFYHAATKPSTPIIKNNFRSQSPDKKKNKSPRFRISPNTMAQKRSKIGAMLERSAATGRSKPSTNMQHNTRQQKIIDDNTKSIDRTALTAKVRNLIDACKAIDLGQEQGVQVVEKLLQCAEEIFAPQDQDTAFQSFIDFICQYIAKNQFANENALIKLVKMRKLLGNGFPYSIIENIFTESKTSASSQYKENTAGDEAASLLKSEMEQQKSAALIASLQEKNQQQDITIATIKLEMEKERINASRKDGQTAAAASIRTNIEKQIAQLSQDIQSVTTNAAKIMKNADRILLEEPALNKIKLSEAQESIANLLKECLHSAQELELYKQKLDSWQTNKKLERSEMAAINSMRSSTVNIEIFILETIKRAEHKINSHKLKLREFF